MVKIVIGPSALAQVPGLRGAVQALRQAGLEERLIVLPEEALPEPELIDRLSGLAAKVLAAGRLTLIGYATPSDPVAEKFRGMVDFPDVMYSRREPIGLRQLLPPMLRDLGLSTAESEAVMQEFLSSAGLEEAA